MIHVKLDIEFPAAGLFRQTPGGKGRWGEHVFHVNEEVGECDYWVVYGLLPQRAGTRCAPENVLLLTGEPPSVQGRYHPRYLAQFATVVTCDQEIVHPRVVFGQTGLPWHVGRRQRAHRNLGFALGYDELEAMDLPVKARQLSLICSTADGTAGHRRRNDFVQALEERLAGEVDVFGRGRREVEDKWEALAPYRYTVVLENSAFPHYWTEKLADAYLAGCFPFYYGCPNLAEYFPAGSFQAVDVFDPQASAAVVEAGIRGTYEKALPELRRARDLVLKRYNLFALVARLCRETRGAQKAAVELRSYAECAPAWRRLGRAGRGWLRRHVT